MTALQVISPTAPSTVIQGPFGIFQKKDSASETLEEGINVIAQEIMGLSDSSIIPKQTTKIFLHLTLQNESAKAVILLNNTKMNVIDIGDHNEFLNKFTAIFSRWKEFITANYKTTDHNVKLLGIIKQERTIETTKTIRTSYSLFRLRFEKNNTNYPWGYSGILEEHIKESLANCFSEIRDQEPLLKNFEKFPEHAGANEFLTKKLEDTQMNE